MMALMGENYKLLSVNWDREAVVVSRPNRFLLIADVFGDDGTVLKGERVHVHDPGRLREIIFSGNRIRIRKAEGKSRSTGWDLISGKVHGDWVLVNSSFHRVLSESILSNPDLSPIKDIDKIEPEYRIGRSRLDFHLIMKDRTSVFLEVKGCTLSKGGKALFPDAPTIRGKRHVDELMRLASEGHGASIMILVLGPAAECFSPNFDTDPDFSLTLMKAIEMGVEVHPIALCLDRQIVRWTGEIPLCKEHHRR
jgi:sugar fermentation stimulation protein A